MLAVLLDYLLQRRKGFTSYLILFAFFICRKMHHASGRHLSASHAAVSPPWQSSDWVSSSYMLVYVCINHTLVDPQLLLELSVHAINCCFCIWHFFLFFLNRYQHRCIFGLWVVLLYFDSLCQSFVKVFRPPLLWSCGGWSNCARWVKLSFSVRIFYDKFMVEQVTLLIKFCLDYVLYYWMIVA